MNKQLFIYSRTQKVDYTCLVNPSDDFCPKEVRFFFRDQVRGLLNADQYTPDFTTPRWLFSRVGNLTLWGVGCWNETLTDTMTTDEVGRRHLRCFVGVVYQGEVKQLPYDLAYFSEAFNRQLADLWTMSRMEQKYKKGIAADEYTGSKVITTQVVPGLNLMANRCLLIAPEKAEKLIGSALIAKGDISIAINLLDTALAFDEKYQFLNATVIGNPGSQIHAFTTPSKIPQITAASEPLFPKPPTTQQPTPPVPPVPPTTQPPTPPVPPVPPTTQPPHPSKPSTTSPLAPSSNSGFFKILAIIEFFIIIALLIAYCSKSSDKDEVKTPRDKQSQEFINNKPNKERQPQEEQSGINTPVTDQQVDKTKEKEKEKEKGKEAPKGLFDIISDNNSDDDDDD